MEGAKRKNEKYLPSPLTTSRHRAPSVLSYLHDDTPQKKNDDTSQISSNTN